MSAETTSKPADTQVTTKTATPNVPTPKVAAPNTNSQRVRVAEETAKTEPKPETAATSTPNASPLEIGSLIGYATKQTAPVYPAAAKSIRASGVVKVEVTVSENGDVAVVDKASGPPMLQAAAKDAIRKWKFKPFTRDGQPVKATGFVNFNFNL